MTGGILRPRRWSPVHVVAAAILFAVGSVCGYLTVVVGSRILWPQDCFAWFCPGWGETWPVGVGGGLVGGVVYAVLGLLAGLPHRWVPAAVPDLPAKTERTTAVLAHLTVFVGVPIVGPGVVALIAGRTAPFLRQHAVAAVRLQVWQLLLIVPTPVLFWPTIGLYTLVLIGALFGGLVYAVIGAGRAAGGKLPAYPANWPPTSVSTGMTAGSIPPERRDHRARIALITLLIGIAASVLHGLLLDG